MKTLFNLFFAFLFVSSSFAQIKVKSISDLNLRSEPTTSSIVLYSFPNGTELLYANDWADGWIKVRYYYGDYNYDSDQEFYYSGWVNAKFVETKMFMSTILDTMSWQEEIDGCFYGIYGLDGLLGVYSYDLQTIKVKIKGVSYNLTISEDDGLYCRFDHPQLKIEFFGAETDRWIESSESSGALRVEYNGKVEYIYAARGGGC